MRLIALICLALAALTLVAPPHASAHTTRIASDPVANAELATGPTRVSATFNEPLQSAFAAMSVVGPDGHLWSTGEPQVQGAVISVAVAPLGPVGRYTVNYRVTSADGHAVTGSWSFSLTRSGTGRPGPTAAAPTEPGVPAWAVLAGAAVLVIGGAAALFGLRAWRARRCRWTNG